jgi:hypothetical protein
MGENYREGTVEASLLSLVFIMNLKKVIVSFYIHLYILDFKFVIVIYLVE